MAAGWSAAFLLVVIASWRYRHAPYHWDALGYVYPHAREIYDAGLMPILRQWDVGHPTGWLFLLAGMFYLFGPGPLAGHVLTWAFAAVLVVAVYGMGRTLRWPRAVAGGGAALTLFYPLVWAQSQQLQLDLPLLASSAAAIYFWANSRRWGWIGWAGLAVLTKLHGPLLLAGPLFALLPGIGALRRRGERGMYIKKLFWTLAPALVFIAFLLVRYWVRGPGMTVNWTTGNQPVPFWAWGEFRGYFPKAWYVLFRYPGLEWMLCLAAVCWGGIGLVRVARRLLGHGRQKALPAGGPGAKLLLLSLAGWAVANVAFFFQSQSLVQRYNLPMVPLVVLLTTLGLWVLFRRVRVVLALQAVLCCVFLAWAYPTRTARLPRPLSSWLGRPVATSGWQLEGDMRFVDALNCIRWAAQTIREDADRTGLAPGVATQWPVNIALRMPPMGYVKEALPAQHVADWSQVPDAACPYILHVKPITNLFDEQAAERLGARQLDKRRRGECRAVIWRIEPTAPPGAAPAPALAPAPAPAPHASVHPTD
jgi:hypothetical protein